MRWLGALLVLLGAIWVMMCFLGTAMMSRSVDFFTETILPSVLGFILALVGVWLFNRGKASTDPY